MNHFFFSFLGGGGEGPEFGFRTQKSVCTLLSDDVRGLEVYHGEIWLWGEGGWGKVDRSARCSEILELIPEKVQILKIFRLSNDLAHFEIKKNTVFIDIK